MKKSNRRGQGMIELAILLPLVLLVVVGGMIDFGFAFYNLILLQQLATDAAQYAAEGFGQTGTSSTGVVQTFVDQKTPAWWGGPGTVVVTAVDILPLSGSAITCRRVGLSFGSRTYTPFYQAGLQVFSGSSVIPLNAHAIFQIPFNLNR